MESNATRSLGRQAEQQAFDYLRTKKLAPVARNFNSRGGEIDLIMLDDDCLTFVEVRCRSNTSFTCAALTVDDRKQRKLVRTAALFIARNPRFANHTMRFDVITIEGNDASDLRWIRDAFRPNDASF